MKNKITTLMTIVAMTIIVASIGCKKGDTGPAGTNGANGLNVRPQDLVIFNDKYKKEDLEGLVNNSKGNKKGTKK